MVRFIESEDYRYTWPMFMESEPGRETVMHRWLPSILTVYAQEAREEAAVRAKCLRDEKSKPLPSTGF